MIISREQVIKTFGKFNTEIVLGAIEEKMIINYFYEETIIADNFTEIWGYRKFIMKNPEYFVDIIFTKESRYGFWIDRYKSGLILFENFTPGTANVIIKNLRDDRLEMIQNILKSYKEF